jgi:mono/diheme cytochrome c family protein
MIPKFVTLLLSLTLCLTCYQLFPSEVGANGPARSAQTSQSRAAERQNPVKATPENLAEAKKFFGFDCAMCHDITGDGKGNVGESMGLKMKDWREPTALASISDGEIFDIIVKGKGKMIGEGDRASTELVWELVNYVRSLSKTETAAVPKSGTSRN